MTIKAGDLVMVVRPMPCCGYLTGLGRVGKAGAFKRGPSHCVHCQATFDGSLLVQVDKKWSLVQTVIRIDPPAGPVSVFDRVEEPA